MTTDQIVDGIDRSLAAIATERDRLLQARAELADGNATAVQAAPQPRRRRSRRRRQGGTLTIVLEALDPTEPRTAGDVEKITKVGRAVAGSTLSRLVKQGMASKAERGYLRMGA